MMKNLLEDDNLEGHTWQDRRMGSLQNHVCFPVNSRNYLLPDRKKYILVLRQLEDITLHIPGILDFLTASAFKTQWPSSSQESLKHWQYCIESKRWSLHITNRLGSGGWVEAAYDPHFFGYVLAGDLSLDKSSPDVQFTTHLHLV